MKSNVAKESVSKLGVLFCRYCQIGTISSAQLHLQLLDNYVDTEEYMIRQVKELKAILNHV